MKKLLLAAYIFFCTGAMYAQERRDTVVATVDFNKQPSYTFIIIDTLMPPPDTIRATLLITRGHMQMAHEKPGYVVFKTKDTIYLDDRRMVLKAPVIVWSYKPYK